MSWVMSLRLPPVRITASGMPPPSQGSNDCAPTMARALLEQASRYAPMEPHSSRDPARPASQRKRSLTDSAALAKDGYASGTEAAD
jgi:hypothetical protein